MEIVNNIVKIGKVVEVSEGLEVDLIIIKRIETREDKISKKNQNFDVIVYVVWLHNKEDDLVYNNYLKIGVDNFNLDKVVDIVLIQEKLEKVNLVLGIIENLLVQV